MGILSSIPKDKILLLDDFKDEVLNSGNFGKIDFNRNDIYLSGFNLYRVTLSDLPKIDIHNIDINDNILYKNHKIFIFKELGKDLIYFTILSNTKYDIVNYSRYKEFYSSLYQYYKKFGCFKKSFMLLLF